MPTPFRPSSLLPALALLLAAPPALADSTTATANIAAERPWHVGARVGANFADMGGGLAIDAGGPEPLASTPRVQERLSGGLTLAYAFGDRLGLRTEVVYSMLGAQASRVLGDMGEHIALHYNLNYIRVPVFVSYTFPYDGVFSQFVFAGPEVGLLVGASVSADGLLPGEMNSVVPIETDEDAKDSTGTIDAGATIGAGVRFPLASGSLIVDVRYTYSVTKVTDNGTFDLDAGGGQMVGLVTDDLRNRGMSINLGFQY